MVVHDGEEPYGHDAEQPHEREIGAPELATLRDVDAPALTEKPSRSSVRTAMLRQRVSRCGLVRR